MTQNTATWTSVLRRYGLVALAFLHIGVGRGLHGTFGVFFVAMLDAFGWSRAATAGVISLAIIFEGACLPWAGGLIDRFGGRKTLISGGLVLAIGLGFASTVSALGIAWAGGGVGIVMLVPLTQLMIDKWGWSAAYIGLAAMTSLLVIPPVQLFMPPSLNPSGKGPRKEQTAAKQTQQTDWTVK
ncbi:MAG: hypothetical protein ACTHLX_11205, partial [Candidatus Binatia bacterium]